MSLVNDEDIHKYAQRNTSPKMPIEAKYVEAYLSSLLNSTSVQEVYNILAEQMQNCNGFMLPASLYPTVNLLNNKYDHIIAYSMVKKDFRLFELISMYLFTGSVKEYHGSDLAENFAKYTDEVPTKYTDSGLTTDMIEGLIIIAFKNYYCNDPLPDGTGSEYQTIDELEKSIVDFDTLITVVKPARIEVMLLLTPYCFLSGDSENILSCGIDTSNKYFSCPFGDETSMAIIDTYDNYKLLHSYTDVKMFSNGGDNKTYYPIDYERTTKVEEDSVTIEFEFKYISDNVESPWRNIFIKSNEDTMYFAQSRFFDPEKDYYERYNPIMLRINDNDPNGPCIALRIEHDVPTIGAVFYTREKKE